MRRISYILLLSVLAFVSSCKKDKTEDETILYCNLSDRSITVPSEANEYKIRFGSNTTWSVESKNPEWLTTSMTSGEGGHDVYVKCTKNNSTDSRSSELIVKYMSLDGELDKDIAVKQLGEAFDIVFSNGNLEYTNLGGDMTITVSANLEWEIINNSDWVTISDVSVHSMIDKSIIVKVEPNNSLNFRKTSVVFKSTTEGTNVIRNLEIYQYGSGSIKSDSLALVDLYNSTKGASWTNKWNLSQPVSKWYGVSVQQRKGGNRVVSLTLSGNNLEGTLPESIGDISFLETLWMENNKLSGDIPTSINNLVELQYIYLFNNSLTGSIPDMGSLQLLVRLYLDNNKLSGSIPESIGNITSLNALGLRDNDLTGSVPASIGALANLRFLFLNNNRLTGMIPPSYRENEYWRATWEPLKNICPQKSGYGFINCDKERSI